MALRKTTHVRPVRHIGPRVRRLDPRSVAKLLGADVVELTPAKGLVSKYAALTLSELREATKEFDREMVVTKSRPLNPREREAWEKARRKPPTRK